MPDKVLIYSRFPKAMMARIGQRFELMDAAGKPPAGSPRILARTAMDGRSSTS